MNPNQRFSILTFPQSFEGEILTLNIVVLPRDQNPLSRAIQEQAPIPDAVAFADAKLSFTASIFDSLNVFPHTLAPIANLPLTTTSLENPREIFEALANHLSIVNLNTTNRNVDLDAIAPEHKPSAARPEANTVSKYLPRSYRRAFNFTSPRHPNAVTDDSYHCAVKGGQPNPSFQRSPDGMSWGKVFAYLMRQPQLAQQAGMIYQTQLTIQPSYFDNGGWLYVDLASNSDYRLQLNTDPTFIKRYAARIPALAPGQSRQVFAPLLFPVQPKAQSSDPDPAPSGSYDRLFIESAEYDDGFAKIVHCQQPPNRDLLVEDNDGAHPTKDIGIRLGWDDEQILIWYVRQLTSDPAGELSGRLDAPLGVFGYSIDVRATAEPENSWESLNAVESRQPLTLTRNPANPANAIALGNFTGELPYQVYPMQIDGRKDANYWLPMYFANWVGHSMVLPDPDAALIYQITNVDMSADPEVDFIDSKDGTLKKTGTSVSGAAQNQLNQIYRPGIINIQLRYGNNYEFRVRLRDLSGGAPSVNSAPINETASDITSCRFKRFISPNQPRIMELLPTGNNDNILVNSDQPTAIPALNIQRPKLGYPAVVYTNKYSNPVQRLIDQSALGVTVNLADLNDNAEHRVGLGIADPDVDRIEITVEIASLKLDKLDSVSGKDDYVHLYTTYRSFPAITTDDDYETNLNIPIIYRDVHVLHTGDEVDLINDLNLPGDINSLTEIVLPTGRTVQLTLRAVCEEKTVNTNYYGFLDEADKRLDNRFGEPMQVMVYQPSADETNLLIQTPGVPTLQGIFMQPDLVTTFDGKLTTLLLGNLTNEQRDNVQQLADRLNIESNNLTLNAPKGERIVFGCSSRIRNTLAPDHSSLTFASKGDLINHWLCCISVEIDRDWMWDALENRSFVITRTKKYSADATPESTDVIVGDIEMIRTASFEALDRPQRQASRLIFIDGVEPKKDQPEGGGDPGFPDTIEVSYSIKVRFKPGHGEQQDEPEKLELILPITTPPAQVPRIVSAGIAMSPYIRNDVYSASEDRKRYLWVEFAEPVTDPNDLYFARVLANAPDHLLSNNNPELLAAPTETPLPIDPEFIRIITPGASNDLAGLNAMQPMEKSTTSDCHYLLPLPAGLHANADEMFGFFTYEFRVGHFRHPNTQEMVWTTAQGRFGRRLRVTGMQHPAPVLTCMPNRDQDKLWVTAPYAVAVHEGKNVTANPPRTQLWALLYAQVKQADSRDYRNILLDDRQLDWRVQVETKKNVNIFEKYNDEQLQVLRSITFSQFKYDVQAANVMNTLKLVDFSTKNRDGKKFGTVVWSNNEIAQLLASLGLPPDLPLSVVVVETLPQITNIFEHVSDLNRPKVAQATKQLVANDNQQGFQQMIAKTNLSATPTVNLNRPSPISDELGNHRLLRTSKLTEVPAICCPTC
ncbi:hypothetical protein IQ276_036985 [Desmonostoc muscorum LEGE 12446]|uniref:Uncharacterized protein n=1 Tax=Desmonostoc muscorum LEGE 12446 TaxID=1828758 RepID=A0A8J7D1U7_DESMC|nr:hypothetical protein [Desmonostoc muscorum]MCF2151907.1 hypothetical protein [Desmonostoc muscorum LEGE 12446]